MNTNISEHSQRRNSSRVSLDDDDVEDDISSSEEEEEDEDLHQLQVESARKFLWDEDDEEANERQDTFGVLGNHSNGPSTGVFGNASTSSAFVWSSHEEIDLEGHLGHRHEIVETRGRAGLFRRNYSSRVSSDRLGLGYGKANKQNSVVQLLKNILLCIQGSVMLLFGCLFGVRHPKRNFCIFLALVLVVSGVVVGMGYKKDAGYIPAPQDATVPVQPQTAAPAPTPPPQAAAVPVPQSPQNNQPHTSPASVISPEAERLKKFKDLLIEASHVDREVLNNENSPQYQALKWIALVDSAKMEPSPQSFVPQRYALATLFFSTASAKGFQAGDAVPESLWHDQTNWMTGSGYCSWYGVECIAGKNVDTNSQVISLNLTSNGLRGHLVPEIQLLSHLDHLDLSSNQLTDKLPADLSKMSNLRTVLLNDNSLYGSIPTEVGSMAKIAHLDLSSNDLRGELPSEVGRLSTLRALILDKNAFITGKLPPLNSLSHLETLSLEHCRFEGTLPPALYLLTSLKHLRLSKNQFSGRIFPDLQRLSHLQTLALSQNLFSKELPDVFDSLKHLVSLDVIMNQFDSHLPSTLFTLPKIENLRLADNNFEGEIPKALEDLTTLKEIYLQKNKFFNTIPDAFEKLSNLEVFDVKDNGHLIGTLPPSLGKCTNLKALKVDGNAFVSPLPSTFGSLTNLEVFNLFSNNFEGAIPEEICSLRNGSGPGSLENLAADCEKDSFNCHCCTRCF